MPILLPRDADILPPSYDHIFKTLLTHPDAKPALIDIVSATIDRTVLDAMIRNNELPTMDTEEKAERLDVNCVVDDGDQVDIEMHGEHIEEPIKGQHISLTNKSIYYLTDLHSSQKSKGVRYADMVRTYQATFCTYTVYPKYRGFITRASLRRNTGEEISDQINFILVELSKLNELLTKPTDKLTSLEAWSLFLRYAPDAKHRNVVNRIIEERSEIAVAGALLMEISQDERERAKFRSLRMYETDMSSNILTAVQRERELQAAETTLEIARSMKAEGIPNDIIAKTTSLPLKKIEQL